MAGNWYLRPVHRDQYLHILGHKGLNSRFCVHGEHHRERSRHQQREHSPFPLAREHPPDEHHAANLRFHQPESNTQGRGDRRRRKCARHGQHAAEHAELRQRVGRGGGREQPHERPSRARRFSGRAREPPREHEDQTDVDDNPHGRPPRRRDEGQRREHHQGPGRVIDDGAGRGVRVDAVDPRARPGDQLFEIGAIRERRAPGADRQIHHRQRDQRRLNNSPALGPRVQDRLRLGGTPLRGMARRGPAYRARRGRGRARRATRMLLPG